MTLLLPILGGALGAVLVLLALAYIAWRCLMGALADLES